MRRPKVVMLLGRGEMFVRRCMGVQTLLHRAGWLSKKYGLSGVVAGGFAFILTSRRIAFARRRISETSCLTELGQRCRGRVPLVGGGHSLGEHGRGRVHSFPNNVLEGVGKIEDVDPSVL